MGPTVFYRRLTFNKTQFWSQSCWCFALPLIWSFFDGLNTLLCSLNKIKPTFLACCRIVLNIQNSSLRHFLFKSPCDVLIRVDTSISNTDVADYSFILMLILHSSCFPFSTELFYNQQHHHHYWILNTHPSEGWIKKMDILSESPQDCFSPSVCDWLLGLLNYCRQNKI